VRGYAAKSVPPDLLQFSKEKGRHTRPHGYDVFGYMRLVINGEKEGGSGSEISQEKGSTQEHFKFKGVGNLIELIEKICHADGDDR
jgi:hypothetical protein